ncbi:hypothetical protein B9Z55_007916 [Caenorhabditis nigoni]|nr:hypothetical protein B9Z55_007916 [Caenorhabditis nigoni]
MCKNSATVVGLKEYAQKTIVEVFARAFEVRVTNYRSKMSVSEEKKFVMKHVFENAESMELDKKYYGPEEKHFGVPWKIYIMKDERYHCFYLECLKSKGTTPWKIAFEVNSKILKKNSQWLKHSLTREYSRTFRSDHFNYFNNRARKKYMIDGKLAVELEVKIKEISGIEIPKTRKFDDDVAKKFSDVVLMVGDQQFHVFKMYLSMHSTYFESLFSGNFAESEKSIIELKDIDPRDFQNFLELIHGDLVLEDSTVVRILKLADYFDAKSAIGRCERFLLENSNKSTNEKSNLAIQYKLENLMVEKVLKC